MRILKEDVCGDFLGKCAIVVNYNDLDFSLARECNPKTRIQILVTSYFIFVQGRSTVVSIIMAMNDCFDKIGSAN